MNKKNLDRKTQELQESTRKGKGKIKNKIMVAALLIAGLASGFCFTMADTQGTKAAESTAIITQAEMQYQQTLEYYDKWIETQAELTAMTAQSEMQYQQTLEYYDRLIETQAELDELQNKPPEIIPIEVPVEIIKEVPVIVEVEKKSSPKFREFEDLTELKGWLEENALPIVLIAGKDGKVDFRNSKSTSQYDCDDYAEDLQRKALEQGFLMSQHLILKGKIFGVKVTKITEPHMGNLTIIGNDIYYIESIPPHSIARITGRDQ